MDENKFVLIEKYFPYDGSDWDGIHPPTLEKIYKILKEYEELKNA